MLEEEEQEYQEVLKEELIKEFSILANKHEEEYTQEFSANGGEGSELLNLFLKVFTQGSVNNEFYGHLVFHTILGQLFKHIPIYVSYNKRDLRIHTFLIQPSGTGKSSGFPFIKRICTNVGIPFYELSGEVSEPALVGGYEQDKKGNVTVIPGILEKFSENGILAWDEAKFLLESTKKQYNASIIQYLTTAMNSFFDNGNRITRHLKPGMKISKPIDFVPKESFLFVTFPIKTNILFLLQEGFFQRVLPYFRNFSDSEWTTLRRDVHKKILEMQTQADNKLWEQVLRKYESDINLISEKLNRLKSFSRNIRRMIIDKSAYDRAEEFGERIDSILMELSGGSKEIFETFQVRILIELYKIAAHRALIDYRVVIKKDDITYAGKLLSAMLTSLIQFTESTTDAVKSEPLTVTRWKAFRKEYPNLIKSLTITSEGIEFSSMVNCLTKFFEMSEASIKKTLNDWEEKGFIKKYFKRVGGKVGTKSYVRV